MKKGWLSKGWDWFSGKKMWIGLIVYGAAKGGQMFFPEAIPDAFYEGGKYAGEIIMGGGFLHKGFKPESVVNKAILSGTQMFKKK